jgi:hypothetical protein
LEAGVVVAQENTAPRFQPAADLVQEMETVKLVLMALVAVVEELLVVVVAALAGPVAVADL